MKDSRLYEICGNHRGGSEHAKLLVSKLGGSRISLAVRLLDPDPGRAHALMAFFERHGVRAMARRDAAPLASDATVRVLAMDDATAMARIVAEPLRNEVVEAGILVAVPTFEGLGGSVMALGTVLTTEGRETQRQAGLVMNRIAALAGERQSSRHTSAPILNSAQVVTMRRRLHDHLTENSMSFLRRGYVKPSMFVVEGLTQRAYPLVAVESKRRVSRRELKDIASQEILPDLADDNDHGGVVYYDSSDPWLYVLLARIGQPRWHVQRTIEIPFEVPAPRRVKVLSAEPNPVPSPVHKLGPVVTD